ncbi:MAG: protein jag [Epsilonproteobacteria bacterium]|nr:protein jag [Campylobacterota bacterium]
MIKIESTTLEGAYSDAASKLECSVTELKIEVVQYPSGGFLGMFKKSAIIVATIDKTITPKEDKKKPKPKPKVKKAKKEPQKLKEDSSHTILNDTIMPQSFVSTQDDEDDDSDDVESYLADYDDKFDNIQTETTPQEEFKPTTDIAETIAQEINELFSSICFEIDKIEVSVYDENTLLIEFKGKDAALLIGKEGYRYKALSYMLFNWINSKYQLQLRLEIAEFLKNQEESVSRYLSGVKESVDRDGRAQTKVLDGVLVQIALRELRDIYPDKYVAIRSTRDGLKYIIINDYHSN